MIDLSFCVSTFTDTHLACRYVYWNLSFRSHLGERVPQLRFPGFDGEWQPVLLKNILHERKTYAEKDGSYPHATLSKEGIYGKTDRYDRDFLVSTENKEYKITLKNDLCYNPANLKFGVICLNTFGSAIFSPIYVTFEIDKAYSPEFVGASLTQKDFIRYALRFQEGTVYERMAVSPEDMLSISRRFPSIAEQTKIAQFVSLIDSRIADQRKLVELLKKHKRGLLRDVFEENIEGDCYSFSEIASRRNEKIAPTKDSRLDCIELEHIEQETGMLLGSVPLSGQNSLKNLCKPSDIVFGKLRPYLRKFVFAENECAVSSETWVLVAAKGIYPKFLFYLIQSEPFMRAASVSSGTKMPRSEWSNVANAKFYVPDRTQQETIAACFSEIDRRILASQRILTAAQAYKRGLLQQLFV